MTSVHHFVKLIPPRLSLTSRIIWPLVLWNDESKPECIDCSFVCLIVCSPLTKKKCYEGIYQNINVYNIIAFNINFSC